MAAKFVVTLALVALSHANPAVSYGEAYRNYGGLSKASANVNGGNAQAYGSSTGGSQLARDGYYYPGQVIAKAETFDNPNNFGYGTSKASAEAQDNGAYYVPVPATVITYEQKFETPESSYVLPADGGISAKSTAKSDGTSDSSFSSASTNGAGTAESNAQTNAGSYGSTSTLTKAYGNSIGSATSNLKNGFGSAESSAKTNGFGSASSAAETNGASGSLTPVTLNEDLDSAVISAKYQGFNTGYTNPGYGSASSNANVNGQYSSASSSAKSNQYRRSWHFGTYYDRPGVISSQGNVYPGYGAAKSIYNNAGYGSANADARINGAGYGTVNSAANTNGHGAAKSSANTNGAGYGSANANANVNGLGYNNGRSTANANANGNGAIISSANTGANFGSAKSTVNSQGSLYGGRLIADAQSNGSGNANSFAKSQGLTTAYRVAESSANSVGLGSANANAQSV